MKEVIRKNELDLKQNFIDKTVSFFSPVRGARRMKARMVMALAGAYKGASKSRRPLAEWNVSAGDADTDIIAELPDLRERSRDLIRNNPLATGAINTKVTSIVGTGLVLRSRIDRNILGMSEDEADAWEKKTEAEWRLWADSTDCDVAGILNFAGIQDLNLRSTLENGDVFVLTPVRKKKDRPYRLQLQTIEADCVCNKNNIGDTDTLSGGIQKDEFGAPTEYNILEGHPGNIYAKNNKWKEIKAYGPKTGRKNVIHLFHKKRVGQTRGVPDLAPVIEELKQLGRYTDAELAATVIGSFFTVFIKSEYTGGMGIMEPQTEVGGKASDKDYKMGAGAILDLAQGEDISIANPGRPNESFDPFVLAMCRQIGTALELPFEILVKHFTASYSAARAAMLEAWRFFMGRRKWLADMLCRPVYELWMTEGVASGRIAAPGFLNGDPLIRAAYLGSEWTGPARGQIDEKKEVDAAEKRVDMGLTTLSEETAALTGGDWSLKHPQRAKEVQKRREAGLEPSLEEINNGTNETVESDTIDDVVTFYENLKTKADFYGVAVRAGAITPQELDEEMFRKDGGFPEITDPISEAWKADEGTRRPITLKAGDAFNAEMERIKRNREQKNDDPDEE